MRVCEVVGEASWIVGWLLAGRLWDAGKSGVGKDGLDVMIGCR